MVRPSGVRVNRRGALGGSPGVGTLRAGVAVMARHATGREVECAAWEVAGARHPGSAGVVWRACEPPDAGAPVSRGRATPGLRPAVRPTARARAAPGRSVLPWGGREPARDPSGPRPRGPDRREHDEMKTQRTTIALAAILIAGALAAQTPEPTNPVVLKVNGEPVYASDVSIAMSEMMGRMQQAGRKVDQQQLVQMATQEVVDTLLLAQEARRRGLQVPAEEVRSQVDRIARGVGGTERLEELLARGGTDMDRFTRQIENAALARKLVDAAVRPGVKVTDDEVKKFYDDNPSFFTRPEQVHARHILFRVPEGADEATRKAAREKAEAAQKRAAAGEDFAKLAEELSEGPSAARGGDLGFFSREQMVKPFADAAFALEPGTVSGVVETRFGYHVIKVEERRPAQKQPFAEAREGIRQYLEGQKVSEGVQKLLEGLRQQAKIEEVAPRAASAAGQGG